MASLGKEAHADFAWRLIADALLHGVKARMLGRCDCSRSAEHNERSVAWWLAVTLLGMNKRLLWQRASLPYDVMLTILLQFVDWKGSDALPLSAKRDAAQLWMQSGLFHQPPVAPQPSSFSRSLSHAAVSPEDATSLTLPDTSAKAGVPELKTAAV